MRHSLCEKEKQRRRREKKTNSPARTKKIRNRNAHSVTDNQLYSSTNIGCTHTHHTRAYALYEHLPARPYDTLKSQYVWRRHTWKLLRCSCTILIKTNIHANVYAIQHTAFELHHIYALLCYAMLCYTCWSVVYTYMHIAYTCIEPQHICATGSMSGVVHINCHGCFSLTCAALHKSIIISSSNVIIH